MHKTVTFRLATLLFPNQQPTTSTSPSIYTPILFVFIKICVINNNRVCSFSRRFYITPRSTRNCLHIQNILNVLMANARESQKARVLPMMILSNVIIRIEKMSTSRPGKSHAHSAAAAYYIIILRCARVPTYMVLVANVLYYFPMYSAIT